MLYARANVRNKRQSTRESLHHLSASSPSSSSCNHRTRQSQFHHYRRHPTAMRCFLLIFNCRNTRFGCFLLVFNHRKMRFCCFPSETHLSYELFELTLCRIHTHRFHRVTQFIGANRTTAVDIEQGKYLRCYLVCSVSGTMLYLSILVDLLLRVLLGLAHCHRRLH